MLKLNPDCIRDILLSLEELTLPSRTVGYGSIADFISDFPALKDYSEDEIAYHLCQCEMNGFLYHYSGYLSNGFQIRDITPKAHEFLANIRSNTIWKNTKSIASKVGTKSLDALIQISSAVIAELIKAQFGIGLPNSQ